MKTPVVLSFLLFSVSLGALAAGNTLDWRYGRPGVLVVTNAPSEAEFSAQAVFGSNTADRVTELEGHANDPLPSYVVTNGGTATLSLASLGALAVSGHTKLGVISANSAGGNAQGSLQAGWNDSLMGSWYVNSPGAWQIGYTGEESGIAVTNLGAGALQLFRLNSPNQKALTTSGGGGSLLLGAGVSSNEHAIVAGSGGYSHGAGSITATGGFWGDGAGLTNIRDTLALTNLSSPTLTGLSLRQYSNAVVNAYVITQVAGAPASALGRYDYKTTSTYTNGLGWQVYVETAPQYTVYVSSQPPLASGTYTFMNGAVPRNSSSGGGIGTGTIQLDYAYSPAAYSTTILSTNGIEGAALRPASVPPAALSTAPLYPAGDGSQLTGLTASQISGLPSGSSSASALVPIVNVTTGALSTVNVSTTNLIYYIEASAQTTITNILPSLNCTSNLSYEIWYNAASTNALTPLWDSRMEWQGGAPEMTCTGLYKCALSSTCGTRIQARQTWPETRQWETPPISVGATANTATYGYGLLSNIMGATGTNGYVCVSTPNPSIYWTIKIGVAFSTAAAKAVPCVFSPVITSYGYANEALGYSWTNIEPANATAGFVSPVFIAPPSATVRAHNGFGWTVTRTTNAGTVYVRNVFMRPSTPQEIQYYNVGGRDFR